MVNGHLKPYEEIRGSSEISGIPVPRSARNRQVVEGSEVIGHLESLFGEF